MLSAHWCPLLSTSQILALFRSVKGVHLLCYLGLMGFQVLQFTAKSRQCHDVC